MPEESTVDYAIRGVHPLDVIPIAADAACGGLPFALLRALTPLPQTVKTHLAIGLHLELALVPVPPAMVTMPMPFLFVGLVDCSIGEIAMPTFNPTGAVDAKTVVYGMPATKAGKKANGLHIPLGSYMFLKPAGKANLAYGSASVDIEGNHAVRLGELGMSCSCLPVPTPTTRVLSYPYGVPVLTGGASVLDPGAAAAMVLDAILGPILEHIFPGDSIPARWMREYVQEVAGTCSEAAAQALDGHPDEAAETAREIFTEDPFEALEAVVMGGVNNPGPDVVVP